MIYVKHQIIDTITYSFAYCENRSELQTCGSSPSNSSWLPSGMGDSIAIDGLSSSESVSAAESFNVRCSRSILWGLMSL